MQVNNDASPFTELDQMAQNLPVTINNYTFEKMIGRGGFSRVFLVSTPKYNFKFCAKVIPQSLQKENSNDMDFLLHLEHPNIIRVYDQFVVGSMSYIIIEYCSGGSLQELISHHKIRGQKKILFFMRQILLAVKFCHDHHIAHRDIKPSNILIDRYGRPKLIDFGISMNVEPGEMVRDFSCSKPYSSPEVILTQPHDPYKADIWSLGVTFYYMIFGKLPWPKEEKVMIPAIEQAHFTIPRNTPPAIAQMITSMLHVDPEGRPQVDTLLKSGLFPESSIVHPLRPRTITKTKNQDSSTEKKQIRILTEMPKKLSNANFLVVQSFGNRNCNTVFKTDAVITTTMTSMDMFNCDTDTPDHFAQHHI